MKTLKSFFKSEAGIIHYEIQGDGFPVLVVPGGPGSSHGKFPELAAHHKVVYFDPLGTGQSDRLVNQQSYTVELYAKTMLQLLDHLGIQTTHVLGVSFGGIPAAEFAASYPERVTSLILSNAQVDAQSWQLGNIDAFNHHIRHQYPEVWEKIMNLRAAGVLSNDPRYQDLLALPNKQMLWAGVDPIALPPSEEETFDEHTYLAFIGNDPEWTINGTLSGHTVLDRLAHLGLPTLILTGRRDLMSSPALAKRIVDALLPSKTTQVIFERSAHRPWAEEPDSYFNLLYTFMERLS